MGCFPLFVVNLMAVVDIMLSIFGFTNEDKDDRVTLSIGCDVIMWSHGRSIFDRAMYYDHKLNIWCKMCFQFKWTCQNKIERSVWNVFLKDMGVFHTFLGVKEVLCTPSCVEEICDLWKCLNILIFELGIKSLIYLNLSSQWVFLFS